MARLTSLVTRDERIGFDGELDQTSRQEVRIGRLDLEIVRPDHPFTRNWERVHNAHDAHSRDRTAREAGLDRRPYQPALQAKSTDDAAARGNDQKRVGAVHRFS